MMFTRCLLLLYFISLFSPSSIIEGFELSPCTFSARSKFQFPNCYLPPLNKNILLSEASFVMAHDSATGYMKNDIPGRILSLYGKTQVGTAYDQLQNGARVLDLRPKLLRNGTMIFHHGGVNLPISFEQLVTDAKNWCTENKDELVLLLHSEMAYGHGGDEDNDDSGDDDNENNIADDDSYETNEMERIYQSLGVPYYECNAVAGLTVEETMELAALDSGGYLLALDRKDYYASFCGKSNWISDQVVTCWQNFTTCTNPRTTEPFASLKQYALASANNEATDDRSKLGPPADLDEYPFNEIQALWQVDVASAAKGMAHFSSIIDDNKKSNVNAKWVDIIYNDEFNGISLFAVDNVALNGNALLSVLRTKCGQSELNNEESCGRAIRKPRLSSQFNQTLSFCITFVLFVGCVSYFGYLLVVARRLRQRGPDAEQSFEEWSKERIGEMGYKEFT